MGVMGLMGQMGDSFHEIIHLGQAQNEFVALFATHLIDRVHYFIN